MKKITVKQKEEAPVALEVLADNILAISEGVKKLRQGRLTDRALVLLIQHASPRLKKGNYGGQVLIPARDVKIVLEGIEGLADAFLKPKEPKP